jgi:hypothetical protein
MSRPVRRGFLSEYARHAGISKQAMAKQLQRFGIDYSKPFDWDKVDRLLDDYRHLGRDHLRKRIVRHPVDVGPYRRQRR